jgi:hypothetical protein
MRVEGDARIFQTSAVGSIITMSVQIPLLRMVPSYRLVTLNHGRPSPLWLVTMMALSLAIGTTTQPLHIGWFVKT